MYTFEQREIPQMTKVSALIQDEKGRVLMLKRASGSKFDSEKWNLAGGKIDNAEDIKHLSYTALAVAINILKANLIREIEEETNINLTNSSLGYHKYMRNMDPNNNVWPIYYFVANVDSRLLDIRLSDESEKYMWVDLSNLPSKEEVAFEQFDVIKEFLQSSKRFDG